MNHSPIHTPLPIAHAVDNSINYLSNNTINLSYTVNPQNDSPDRARSDRNCKIFMASTALGTAIGFAIGVVAIFKDPDASNAATTPIAIMLGAASGMAVGAAGTALLNLRDYCNARRTQVTAAPLQIPTPPIVDATFEQTEAGTGTIHATVIHAAIQSL